MGIVDGIPPIVLSLIARRLMVWTPRLPNGIAMSQSGSVTAT
jgi:hypothetical protein